VSNMRKRTEKEVIETVPNLDHTNDTVIRFPYAYKLSGRHPVFGNSNFILQINALLEPVSRVFHAHQRTGAVHRFARRGKSLPVSGDLLSILFGGQEQL